MHRKYSENIIKLLNNIVIYMHFAKLKVIFMNKSVNVGNWYLNINECASMGDFNNVIDGTTITLPNSAKPGSYFIGWFDGENIFKYGSEYLVNKDIIFIPKYVYYGDLNSTGEKITEEDLNIMRNVISGNTSIDSIDNGKIAADIDLNGELNIIDLLRQKKIYSQVNVTVGAQ